jgi:hypothetical protein
MCCFGCGASAGKYHGGGVMDYIVHNPVNTGPRTLVTQFTFEFSVADERWRIVTRPLAEHDVSEFAAYHDGTNTYCTVTFNLDKYLNRPLKIDKTKSTNVVAGVFPGDMPPERGDGLAAVWLAFCSGSQFLRASNNLVRPAWFYSEPAMYCLPHYVPSTFTMLNIDPPLVGTCNFLCDGFEYGLSNRTAEIVKLYKFPEPFDSGFARAQYVVAASTNLAGRTFPQSFSLRVYSPKQGGVNVEDLTLNAEYKGTLTNGAIGYGNLPSPIGMVPKASVSDYRTLEQKPPLVMVRYQSPSTTWLAFEPGTAPYKLYKMQLGSALIVKDKVSPRPSTTRAVTIVLFAASALAIGVVARLCRKAKTTNA